MHHNVLLILICFGAAASPGQGILCTSARGRRGGKDKVLDLTSEMRTLSAVTEDLRLLCSTYETKEVKEQSYNRSLEPLMMDLYIVVDRQKFLTEYDEKSELPQLVTRWNAILKAVTGSGQAQTIDGPTIVHSLKVFPMGRQVLEACRKMMNQVEEYCTWKQDFFPKLNALTECREVANFPHIISQFDASLQNCPPASKVQVPRFFTVGVVAGVLKQVVTEVTKALDFSTQQETSAN